MGRFPVISTKLVYRRLCTGSWSGPPRNSEPFCSSCSASTGSDFGPPHLNLRQPFDWEYGEESLKKAV